MISTYKHQNLIWYDLESPTQDEIKKLTLKYNIDLEVANELLYPSDRAKVNFGSNYINIILHFPNNNIKEISNEYEFNEIDFIIGKDFIITTRYKNVDSLHEFSKIFEINSVLNKKEITKHGGLLFFYMLQNLYQALDSQLQNIKDSLIEIENNIFNGKEKSMVFELSKQHRILLRFKEAINDHQEVFNTFEIISENFFKEDFSFYMKSIIMEYKKVKHSLINNQEYLQDLRKTNDSMLTSKQNEIMKNLTVMASIVLPLSLLASIFGMNAEFMPIVSSEDGFYKIILLMLITATASIIFFKKKKFL